MIRLKEGRIRYSTATPQELLNLTVASDVIFAFDENQNLIIQRHHEREVKLTA
ncbi:MAG: hypothetical protein QXP80_06690 [Zestosphaera sp.]